MTDPAADPTQPAQAAPASPPESAVEPRPELVEEELLVEDVSIDGMCGVY